MYFQQTIRKKMSEGPEPQATEPVVLHPKLQRINDMFSTGIDAQEGCGLLYILGKEYEQSLNISRQLYHNSKLDGEKDDFGVDTIIEKLVKLSREEDKDYKNNQDLIELILKIHTIYIELITFAHKFDLHAYVHDLEEIVNENDDGTIKFDLKDILEKNTKHKEICKQIVEDILEGVEEKQEESKEDDQEKDSQL